MQAFVLSGATQNGLVLVNAMIGKHRVEVSQRVVNVCHFCVHCLWNQQCSTVFLSVRVVCL